MTISVDADGGIVRISTRLAAFVSVLRSRGLSIGIGAELDLGRGLAALPSLTSSTLRDACRATLAKSPADLELLEEAFSALESGIPVGATAQGPVAPTSRPTDGHSTVTGPPRPPPMVIDATGSVRIGTYSPEAPPTPHSLRPLDGRELAALRAGARRFRRYAATLPGRRFTHSNSGRIDFRATARSSVRQGGEWIDLRRARRKPARTELAVLWDVSGSMREHAREMFALAYALQRVNRRSRLFGFSTALQDFTAKVAGRPYALAARTVSESLGVAGGGTRIAACLEEFVLRHGPRIRRRTTLLILSDGWDLGEADALRTALCGLRRRAGLLVWVNPYARSPGFRPETVAMAEAVRCADVLLGPEDFASLRAFPTVISGSASRGAVGFWGKSFNSRP